MKTVYHMVLWNASKSMETESRRWFTQGRSPLGSGELQLMIQVSLREIKTFWN